MIEWENQDIIIELTPEGRDGASVTARGVWDENEHYYYLDIVTYHGGSYLAKTDVPAGTLPTDTTYWQVVASNAHWGDITGDLSDQTDLQTALNAKADASSVYTKTAADALLAVKADKDSVYTKTEADALLAEKADADDVYTKTQVDDALYLKADKADTYTKTELDGIFDGIDNALDSKADASDVYTKAQADSLLAGKANTADLGTMAGVNDAPSDGKQYARKNGQWAEVQGGGGGGSAEWGGISGTLSDQTDLQTALDNKAPVILNTASGSIASFSDGSPAPVTALSVGIEPVQDLHGYANPWPAGGGKNLCNPANVETITIGANTRYGYVFDEGTYYFCKSDSTDAWFRIYQNDISEASSVNVPTTPASRTIASGYHLAIFMMSENDAKSKLCVSTQSISKFEPYSNVCPISGHTSAVVTRTGKNLLKGKDITQTVNTMDCSFTIEDALSISGTNSSANMAYFGLYPNGAGTRLPIKAGTYTFSSNTELPSSLQITMGFRDSSGNSIGVSNVVLTSSQQSKSFTLPVDCELYINCSINGSATLSYDGGLQLELGSTATSYEPYQGTSLTIDLDGTRYGGGLDVLTGELTVTKVLETLTSVYGISSGCAYQNMANNLVKDDLTALTSYLKTTTKSISNLSDGEFSTHGGNANVIWLKIAGCSTKAEYNTYLTANPLQVVYTLATPITVQLTPSQISTLLGQNAIWANTGDTSVEYRADTKRFIENLTKPSEDDMTANANIASGKYFMVGNNLFLSTASIATGDAIKPGTNCTALSLAEALNAINA